MFDSIAPGLLFAGAVLNGFVVLYLLVGRAHRTTSNLWFALLLVALMLRFGKSGIQSFVDVGSTLRNIGLVGMLGMGPALAAFVMERAVPTSPRDWLNIGLHAGPALILLLTAGAVPNAPGHSVAAVVYILVLAHLAGYLAITWRALRERSAIDNFRLAATAVVSAYWLAWVGIAAGAHAAYVWLCALQAAVSTTLCWLVLTRHRWLTPIWTHERYSHLPQSQQEVATLFARANELVMNERLFADATLTIERLARRLVVPRAQLSRAINEGSGQTFRAWLNAVRVAHARQAIEQGWLEQHRLIDLAEASGFASLSSFNRAFRAVTGVAPSFYGRRASGGRTQSQH